MTLRQVTILSTSHAFSEAGVDACSKLRLVLEITGETSPVLVWPPSPSSCPGKAAGSGTRLGKGDKAGHGTRRRVSRWAGWTSLLPGRDHGKSLQPYPLPCTDESPPFPKQPLRAKRWSVVGERRSPGIFGDPSSPTWHRG